MDEPDRPSGLIRGLLLTTATLAACVLPARGQAPEAALTFSPATVDAGEVYQFAVLEHRFEFTNNSDRDVHITGVQAGDPAAEVDPESGRFAAGSGGSIRIRQPVGARLGEAVFRYTVLTDDPVRPALELVLGAFVQSTYDTELPYLDFGDVDRSRGKTLSLEVASREASAVHLVEVVRAPAFITVTPRERTGILGENVALNVALAPSAPVGLYGGVVHLRTDIAHHPDYLVRFRASVYGDVVPDQSPLQLGVVRPGVGFSAQLRLGSRTGKPFRVTSVRDSQGRLTAGARPCRGGSGPSACWIVTVEQTPQEPGRLDGVLQAQVDGRMIPLTYTGMAADSSATGGGGRR